MTTKSENNWINLSEALRVAKSYPKGPHTPQGLIWAGEKGSFSRKASDGFHWEFDKSLLKRYCEIANKPTHKSIADSLGINRGIILYLALKYQIRFKVEMGRKYLEESDAEELARLYKENHNG